MFQGGSALFPCPSMWEIDSALLCSSGSFSLSAAVVMISWSLLMWAFNWGLSFSTAHLTQGAPRGRGLLTLPKERRASTLLWGQNRKWQLGGQFLLSSLSKNTVCVICSSSTCIQSQQELSEQELDASPMGCCHINCWFNP